MAGYSQHLVNDVVYIKFAPRHWRVLYGVANSSYNSTGTSGVRDDAFERLLENLGFEIALGEQSHASVSIIGNARQRLVNFMCNGSCQFAHRCQSGDPGEFRPDLVKSLFRKPPCCDILNRRNIL